MSAPKFPSRTILPALLISTFCVVGISACGVKGDLTRPSSPVFGKKDSVRPISTENIDISDNSLPGDDVYDDFDIDEDDLDEKTP